MVWFPMVVAMVLLSSALVRVSGKLKYGRVPNDRGIDELRRVAKRDWRGDISSDLISGRSCAMFQRRARRGSGRSFLAPRGVPGGVTKLDPELETDGDIEPG